MDIATIRAGIAEARAAGRLQLSEAEALAILTAAGVRTVPLARADNPAAAAAEAERIGFPVVLKIVSPDIAHKTEVGGVAVGLNSAAEVAARAAEMLARVRQAKPEAAIEGFMLQGMARGIETVSAVTCEPGFGPVLAFGLGGVWIEVLKDIVLRIVPASRADVEEMVAEIKGAKLLQGWRGAPPADRAAVCDTLLCLSALMAELSEEIAEVEINPLIVGPDGALAADALLRLHALAGKEAAA